MSVSEEKAGPDPRYWGFVGSGRMATALVRGMIEAEAVQPGHVLVSDIDENARARLSRLAGVRAVGSNRELAERCGVVVIAVKPQVLGTVSCELAEVLTDANLVISIAAGANLRTLRGELGPHCRLARAMPNMPALVGAGASAFCMGSSATEADEELVRSMLCAVGQCHRLGESLLDAVTGLSGSGPAFVFMVIEALSDGGVRAGLPRDIATALAAQTVLGAARLVIETKEHPGALKDQVASPGGTTIAGIAALERGGLRSALIEAVASATARARELAEDPGGRDPTGIFELGNDFRLGALRAHCGGLPILSP